MSTSHSELEHILGDLLPRVIDDCDSLNRLERLSGGASQETYRITIASSKGERLLAMRRAAGGEEGEITAQHPGLAVEALLMQVARAQGVPEPEVYYVLQAQDGIGAGFIMQWLEGEALGARIVKAPELDAVRPKLAHMFGVTLAIHSIDLQATGSINTNNFPRRLCAANLSIKPLKRPNR